MGIKGLPNLIKNKTGNYASKAYKFSKFKGISIAIDASLMIHQTVIGIRASGKDMENSKGQLTSHLHGILYKSINFLENGQKIIYVFDGKPPAIKSQTLSKRAAIKDTADKNLETLTDSDSEEYIKNFKKNFRPKNSDMKEAQILLDLMGIPYIIAPGEADVVLAWLASRSGSDGKKYVKGVCSDDSDMLAFGSPYLFKNMLKFMNKNKEIYVISLKRTLEKMKLNMKQFVDLCVLLGTDNCKNLRGIGPDKAYELIHKVGSLEKILEQTKIKNDKRIVLNDKIRKRIPGYIENLSTPEVIKAKESKVQEKKRKIDDEANRSCMIPTRDYFLNAVTELDQSKDFVISDDQVNLRKCQSDELIDFLCIKHEFDLDRIQKAVKRIELAHKKMGITKENSKKVHRILLPKSQNQIFFGDYSQVEFNSDSDSDSPVISKKNSSKKFTS